LEYSEDYGRSKPVPDFPGALECFDAAVA
jgi:hypothetical protein